MKKLFALLAVCSVLFAAGCQKSKEAEIPELPENFSATIDMDYADASMKAKLTQSAQGIYGVDVIEPEILDPLTFSGKSGEISASYGELQLEGKSSDIPQKDGCSLLFEALNQVYSGTATQSPVNNGLIVYSGVISGGEFMLTRSVSSGSWVEFRVNDSKVDVLFSEYKTN